ncbi:hypothetical protein SAMN04487869_101334 [Marinobacter sp. DSM 26671]|uniref:HAMP domain-containing protein n=1 Tax=Marinobacter sp. DSM 26671 TaxID=1761793 RepID=UPI0008E5E4DA|nr:HAMP domain-containing protein [Marinobacter sp. DSM 26671]SFD95480.1 hypothetical protein SAMN04487869_101334 [Marinobacter sp. DSM 26671]
MKLSIREQAVLGIGLIEVFMLLVLLYSVFHFIDRSSAEEIDRRAHSIAQIFAATTADDVLSLDLASLRSFVDQAAQTPETAFARIIDYNGHLLAEAGDPDALMQAFQPGNEAAALPDIYMAKADIIKADQSYGSVEVGLDLRNQKQEIATIKGQSLFIAALEVLAAAAFSIAAGYYLVRRLNKIRHVLEEANLGHYQTKVADNRYDEVAEVASEIDRLTDRITWEKETRDRKISELEDINHLLHQKLAELHRMRR